MIFNWKYVRNVFTTLLRNFQSLLKVSLLFFSIQDKGFRHLKRNCSVSVVPRLQAGWLRVRGLVPGIVSSPEPPHQLYGTPSLLSNGQQGALCLLPQRPVSEADHAASSIGEVTQQWSGAIPPSPHTFYRRVFIIAKSAYLLASYSVCLSALSVRPSAFISTAPNGEISVKFGIGNIFESMSRTSNFG